MNYGEENAQKEPSLLDCKDWEDPNFNRWITTKCLFHGKRRAIQFRCGECDGCFNQWAGRVKARIYQGVMQRGGSKKFRFLTLTMCRFTPKRNKDWSFSEDSKCYSCEREYEDHRPTNADQIMMAWRKLRRSTAYRNRYGRPHFYRVLDPHADGKPHLHFAMNWNLTIPRINTGEKLHDWMKRLSPEAQEFQQLAMRYGFGPMMSSEHPNRGAGGVANYMGNYMAKVRKKQWVRKGATFSRIVDCSKGWLPPVQRHKHRWTISYNEESNEKPTTEIICECGETKPGIDRWVSRWVENRMKQVWNTAKEEIRKIVELDKAVQPYYSDATRYVDNCVEFCYHQKDLCNEHKLKREGAKMMIEKWNRVKLDKAKKLGYSLQALICLGKHSSETNIPGEMPCLSY